MKLIWILPAKQFLKTSVDKGDINMRYLNVFKPIKKKNSKLEYSDTIIKALLDPNIKGLCLNFHQGYDWVDRKYGFVKLLIQRGQVVALKSGSDLLAHDDYLEALWSNGRFINVILENRTIGEKGPGLYISPKFCSYASPKRIEAAQKKMHEYALNLLNRKAV